jgi:hypothetical protein
MAALISTTQKPKLWGCYSGYFCASAASEFFTTFAACSFYTTAKTKATAVFASHLAWS